MTDRRREGTSSSWWPIGQPRGQRQSSLLTATESRFGPARPWTHPSARAGAAMIPMHARPSDLQRVRQPIADPVIPCVEVERIKDRMPFSQERTDTVSKTLQARLYHQQKRDRLPPGRSGTRGRPVTNTAVTLSEPRRSAVECPSLDSIREGLCRFSEEEIRAPRPKPRVLLLGVPTPRKITPRGASPCRRCRWHLEFWSGARNGGCPRRTGRVLTESRILPCRGRTELAIPLPSSRTCFAPSRSTLATRIRNAGRSLSPPCGIRGRMLLVEAPGTAPGS